MAIIGGSPLGLIGVRSRPDTSTGKSTLPWDGNQISVAAYNNATDRWNYSKEDPEDAQKRLTGPPNAASISIFNRSSKFTPYPEMGVDGYGNQTPDITTQGLSVSRLHSDTLYDTSILNILKNLEGTKAALNASHFAYLKNVGVYPNNRLVIARRFGHSTESSTNIVRKGTKPLAIMIGYVTTEDNFFEIQYGEDWVEAEADFTQVLNDLGDDFMTGNKKSELGTNLAGGMGVLPMPMFTEYLQRTIYEKLGIMKPGSNLYIPAGEPNLIKQAKRRATVPMTSAGSGLKCSFTVKVTCEWEQKFISGIDPTVVYLDILQQCLRFATSNSVSFGLSTNVASKIEEYVNNPTMILTDLMDALKAAGDSIVADVKKQVDKLTKSGQQEVKDNKIVYTDKFDILGQGKGKQFTQAEYTEALRARSNKMTVEEYRLSQEKKKEQTAASGQLAEITSQVTGFLATWAEKVLEKYKERIRGILYALSGLPSGPWHVTIGNPLRPVFSSGDLILNDQATLTLGSTLAFNDLPSTIKLSFTLAPARPLGLQEIFERFNSGHVRTVLAEPTLTEKKAIETALGVKSRVEGPNVGPQKQDVVDNPTVDKTKPQNDKTANQNVSNNSSGTDNSVVAGGLTSSQPPIPTGTASNSPNISGELTSGSRSQSQQDLEALLGDTKNKYNVSSEIAINSQANSKNIKNDFRSQPKDS